MYIPMLDLPGQYQRLKAEIDAAIGQVIASGHYIMGPAVAELEADLEQFLAVKHAITVASGTDALLLSLDALGIGPGDKVIVPTFTFFATAGVVTRLGGIPVFVDIDPADYNLDLAQVEKRLQEDPAIKAIIPVHLFGRPCDMERLMALARQYNLKVVEDACQAINATVQVGNEIKKVGTIGDAGCFSFFPSKNLGCFGDGGLIVTNNDKLADKLRMLRVHGSRPKYFHQMVGYNSRLDTIQAAVLKIKLKYLNEWTEKRVNVARRYHEEFRAQGLAEQVVIPPLTAGHVFHQYVIRVEKRDQLAAYLTDRGIGNAVYYPLPLHLQPCYAGLGYQPGSLPVAEAVCQQVLALPIDPELTREQIRYIVTAIKNFMCGEK